MDHKDSDHSKNPQFSKMSQQVLKRPWAVAAKEITSFFDPDNPVKDDGLQPMPYM